MIVLIIGQTILKLTRTPRFPGDGVFHRHDAHDENELDSEQISGPVIDLGAHASHEDSHAG